ncbi:hypothetical protein E2C01_051911 [Portunus trituberculatus]|uniref:Uncharacterized protein n=1 Tax=Portunus trituberculatus TaxID=210409 RepID=A0A5B7GK21_PORTR|nr:hypothetical protein [Portunus trituberculatus]
MGVTGTKITVSTRNGPKKVTWEAFSLPAAGPGGGGWGGGAERGGGRGGNGGRSRLAASFVISLPPGLLQNLPARLLHWAAVLVRRWACRRSSSRGAGGKKATGATGREEVVEGGQKGR